MLFIEEDMAKIQLEKSAAFEPNTHWNYSSGTTNLLSGILRRQFKTHREYLDFWYASLIDRIGMHSMLIEPDMAGNCVGSSYGWATARDWAKFGEFLRNNGSVRSAQMMPTSWMRFMKTPSQTDTSYGGHLWLNRTRNDGRDGVLFPGKAPADVFAALGHLGQFVVVSPQHRLTIVRLGNTPDDQLDPVNDQLAKLISVFPKR
jgi:CubicO group peptidase (beta-lactamase class C family)